MTVLPAAVLSAVGLFFVKNTHPFSICPIKRLEGRYWKPVPLSLAAKSSSAAGTAHMRPQRQQTRNKQQKRNRRPWTYSPLSDARHQKQVVFVNELEEGIDVEDVESNLNVIAQWARLGEGERAEAACNRWMVQSSTLDKHTKDNAYRRVLHAWCNQLTRMASSRRDSPSSGGQRHRKLADRAERVLEKMGNAEADDYQASIQAHVECLQLESALLLLDQCKEPTPGSFGSVIRGILSPYSGVEHFEHNNTRISPVAMAHKLLEDYHESNVDNELSTQVYNRVLNAFSKSLAPFDKRTFPRRHTKSESDIIEKVEWLWNLIDTPDAKSFVLMIYSYCKSGRVGKAFEIWERLMERLLSNTKKKERVDARSFRMLVKALSVSRELDSRERIDRVIQGMWDLHEVGYYDTAPDVYVYTTAMNAWAQHGDVDHVRGLLKDLETRYQALGWKSLKADAAVYNSVIHAISRRKDKTIDSAEEAGTIVKQMERIGIEPDFITYNSLMDVCLSPSCQEGRERAEQTLLWMVRNFKKGNARVKPSLKSFSSVINAWTAADSPERAEALLDIMEERYRVPASLYEDIVESWCNQATAGDNGKEDAAKRAKMLLQRMQDLFEATGNAAIRPSMSLYNQVIKALNDSGNPRDIELVRRQRDRTYPPVATLKPGRLTSSSEVFDLLQYLDNVPQMSPRPQATAQECNYVISQLGKSGKSWAGPRAEDILMYMLANKEKISPTTVTFNSVMSAYVKSSHPRAGEKAAAVLEKMKETNDEALKPDIVTYSTLLNALANSEEPDGAKRAEAILLQMLKDHKADDSNVKVNTICFNEVLYAWARSTDEDASKRAEMVLKLMEDMASKGNEDVMPDTRTYNIVLYALANSKEDDAPIRSALLLDRMRNSAAKPDLVSYSTAISGLGSVNSTIMFLEDLYENDIELDSRFFSKLIYSLTRTGAEEAPIAAEIILLDLIKRIESGEVDVQIDTDVYNALINCWGKSGSKGSAARAVEILQEMEDDGSPHTKPNVQSYASAIDACAKSRDVDEAKRAEEILNRMEEKGVCPNSFAYTAVVQAHARSISPSKARHAQTILHRMKDDFANGNVDARPSVVTYNAVLNACEFTIGGASEMEEAFRVACEALDEIRSSEYLKPDEITYGTFLGVITKLMPKSETTNELIELVVKRARNDGQLGAFTLKKLKDAVSVSRYKRLISEVPDKGSRRTVDR